MKREEEIQVAAREYEASPIDWDNEDSEIRDFFKRGAEWSDEHPREGLVDIEAVCEYLRPILEREFGYYCGQNILDGMCQVLKTNEQ